VTGQHAYGPGGDSARLLAGIMGRRDPGAAAMASAAGRRAMALGCELDTLNRVRARRAELAMPPRVGATAAGEAAWLMGTAHLDARRRQLRGMLADALLGY
jgi:hypothetical protein